MYELLKNCNFFELKLKNQSVHTRIDENLKPSNKDG